MASMRTIGAGLLVMGKIEKMITNWSNQVAIALLFNVQHLVSNDSGTSLISRDDLSKKLAEQTVELEYLRSKVRSL